MSRRSPQYRAMRAARALRARGRRAYRSLLGAIVKVRTEEAAVALTFDDGPHPLYTPDLLEVLERYDARGTFFMIGRRAREHAEIVQRAAGAGHCIGNHSWDHPAFPSISARERRRQLRLCAQATRPFGVKLFRPPRSLQSVGSYLTVRGMGYDSVLWSGQIGDWRPRDSGRMATDLIDRISPGRIVVLHDALWQPSHPEARDRSTLITVVETVLERLAGHYRFTTVPELLRLGRPIRVPWFVRDDDDWDSPGRDVRRPD